MILDKRVIAEAVIVYALQALAGEVITTAGVFVRTRIEERERRRRKREKESKSSR